MSRRRHRPVWVIRAYDRPVARLQYVGHGTVHVELDGVGLLTDPLLRSRVAHLRRAAPLPAVPRPDAVLISHGHYDHLDLPSLRKLGTSPRVIVPRGLGGHLAEFDVLEVSEGDEVEVGAVTIRATHAEHEGGRPLRGDVPALGYVIFGSRRLFFAGDTDLFDGMDGLVAELDVALLPIWGWGADLGRGKHLDPERAAEAAKRLRPKLAVPIHWGTYRPLHRTVQASFLHEPPDAFARIAAEVAPEVEVRILRPGEQLGF
jgi:L-ascorbate metabolism protein UlaG (beta-lactamase superfamily)